jgi:pimeloyl-ACP methyl ester carboxylesterase
MSATMVSTVHGLRSFEMKTLIIAVAITMLTTSATALANPEKPTVILVHGAFADSSSWIGVARILEEDGYSVVAVANPLRSVRSDAQYVDDIVAGIESQVVLVGHSYGGFVISAAHLDSRKVKSLVYVSAFAPDVGETASGLSVKFPGSTLGAALAAPVALSGGGKDLYIRKDLFHRQFAADVSAVEAAGMAVAQRPVTEAALNEAVSDPRWKSIPSWFIYGDEDRNIPAQALAFMAERAKSKQTDVVRGASHVVMISNPKAVAKMIERAAATP